MDNEFPEQCAISHSDNSKSSVNEIYMQNLVTQEGGDRVTVNVTCQLAGPWYPDI